MSNRTTTPTGRRIVIVRPGPHFLPIVPATGRIKDFRLVIECDFSEIESRVIAAFGGDPSRSKKS